MNDIVIIRRGSDGSRGPTGPVGPGAEIKSLKNDYSSNLSLMVATIGSTDKVSVAIDVGGTLAADTLDILSNISLIHYAGCEWIIEDGKTLTISGSFEAGLYQVFNCVGTGKVSGLKESSPWWFGAVVNNSTDDQVAWQNAMDSIATTGGVVHSPIGTSYVGSPIIWPNDGTNTYAIRVQGQDGSSVPGNVATATGGVSSIRFGGSGNLFDMRNGDDSLLQWYGSIENMQLWGPNGATAKGLYIYKMLNATIKNVQIKSFGGYGVYVANWMFYSTIENLRCYYNGYGFYAPGATLINGTTINNSSFSNSTTDGFYAAYAGKPINLERCWFENNGRFGANLPYAALVNLDGCYFENNTNVDLVISSSPFYQSTLNLYGTNFEDNATHYSVQIAHISTLNSIGSKFGAYSTNGAINITAGSPKGIMAGNTWPRVDGVNPMAISFYGNFLWNDDNIALGQNGSFPVWNNKLPYGGFYHNTAPLSNGGDIGWIISTPGVGGSVTALSGITADTTATNATVAISSAANIPIGSYISIAGVDFGTSALSYAKVVTVNSAMTSIELDEVANQTVAGAAVSWSTASYKSVSGMIFDRSTASVSSSGTGEDTLRSTTIPAGMMSTYSGFKVFAAGTKAGANGNKTLKFHFGATSVTFHAAANTTTDWRFEAYVYNVGAANTQGISWVGYDGITILQGYDTAAIDTVSAVTMKITGECAHASDVITQTIWLVEPK